MVCVFVQDRTGKKWWEGAARAKDAGHRSHSVFFCFLLCHDSKCAFVLRLPTSFASCDPFWFVLFCPVLRALFWFLLFREPVISAKEMIVYFKHRNQGTVLWGGSMIQILPFLFVPWSRFASLWGLQQDDSVYNGFQVCVTFTQCLVEIRPIDDLLLMYQFLVHPFRWFIAIDARDPRDFSFWFPCFWLCCKRCNATDPLTCVAGMLIERRVCDSSRSVEWSTGTVTFRNCLLIDVRFTRNFNRIFPLFMEISGSHVFLWFDLTPVSSM